MLLHYHTLHLDIQSIDVCQSKLQSECCNECRWCFMIMPSGSKMTLLLRQRLAETYPANQTCRLLQLWILDLGYRLQQLLESCQSWLFSTVYIRDYIVTLYMYTYSITAKLQVNEEWCTRTDTHLVSGHCLLESPESQKQRLVPGVLRARTIPKALLLDNLCQNGLTWKISSTFTSASRKSRSLSI